MQILNRWLCDPSALGLWTLLTLLGFATLPAVAFQTEQATSEQASSENDSEGILERFEAAMKTLLKLNPRHPINKDSEYRHKMAGYFLDASAATGENPYLLLTIAYCESTLRPSAVGKKGEIGLGQVHGEAARGCELETAAGQIMCTAKWLAYCRSLCDGTDEQALTRYATGARCQAERGGQVDRLVRYRMRIYKQLVATN